MDNKKPAPVGDNSNAPGTYPKADLTPSSIETTAFEVSARSNDSTAPNKADPLNGGVPTHQANEAPDNVIELELGGTGTIIVGGVLVGADYNPDLSGTKRVKIYDKMRKSDSTVRLGLAAIKEPIMAAKWYIDPGDGEEEDGEKATFLRQELFENPNFTFASVLRQSLTFVDFGASHFEKVWRKRADGRIGWKKFAQRLPQTIYRYTFQDGITPGITQYLPTGGAIEIPQWKLLSCILNMEGSNYEGESMLRSVYMHWYYKDLYYRIDAIASERQGMGVPIIRVPSQALEKDKIKAKNIARNLRVNEEAYVDLPPGFTLEYIDTKSQTLKQVVEMVMHHDRQILKGLYAHFLDMGASSAGSHNLSKDQSDLYKIALRSIARVFHEPMQLAANELIDLNFSNVKPNEYPKIKHGQIGSIDFTGFSTFIKDMTGAGVIVPDPSLERHVRNTADLPEADDPTKLDEEDQKRRKVGFPPPPLLGPGGVPGKPGLPAGGGGLPKPKPKKMAEDILQFMEEIQTIIAEKEAEYEQA